MTQRIFIGVAWPYANGPLHLGHIAGAYLPSDIFARYHRLKGNEVLMVSGSDQHGTPITIRAEQEGKTPKQVAAYYHDGFLQAWDKLGISFDLFTSTETDNHKEVAQDVFRTLLEKNYIYKDTQSLPYCESCKRFLPDRYVEGECPNCGFKNSRGDQCDECGKPLNASELKNLHCNICGNTPQFVESDHYLLRLSAFNDKLSEWVKKQTHFRKNVQNFSARLLKEGLHDRAITRDIDWGIPVPVPDFESKRLYVWFEAVIGYLSASKEWAKSTGNPDKWQDFWTGDCKSYYFIGKDNIPFHTVIWPAMLMAYGQLNLPYDVPSNEHLTLEGKQFSTSRNWGVSLQYYLDKYAPDPLRYMLSINMPETSDTDFSWREYVRRNNDELVATYGNLVHRVLTFTYRNYDEQVPEHPEYDGLSIALLDEAKKTLQTVGNLLEQCKFRAATREAMALAQKANQYLDESAPWKRIKEDRDATAAILCTVIEVISCLKTVLYPFLPFSSQKLHNLLGFEGNLQDQGWTIQIPESGQKLEKPEPLFTKLDDDVIKEEVDILAQGQKETA
ncbi:MAG: methionine--tRNA ligase [Chloroflexi bacterium]|jgi:methionyl-tRNA synthetase|nr:methionine--tRNA ligase [Chloroflexota bacterium]MBT7081767.1 methionine--tRNA ligase [Chloroflexota bacterium]MBT7289407.1 methionine--tRNA ligase [Chloroflexota bacterium]